jgi:hypothetical protein
MNKQRHDKSRKFKLRSPFRTSATKYTNVDWGVERIASQMTPEARARRAQESVEKAMKAYKEKHGDSA